MLDRLSGLPLHRFFYIVALMLIAIGVSLNKVVMSVGTIMLFSSWVLEGDFQDKVSRIKGNKAFWVGISLYLIHIIGLLWTEDFNYGFHDLRAKLPLFVIPFVLATIPAITRFEFKLIIYAFIISVLLTTLVNFLVFKGIIPNSRNPQNFRDYSIFISHIRLSLMVDFAIFCVFYFLLKDKSKMVYFIPVLIWFAFYTYFSQIISGFIYLFILILVAAIFIGWRSRNPKVKFGIPVLFGIVLIAIGAWLGTFVSEFYSIPKEEKGTPEFFTENGNPYVHDWESEIRENGNFIYWHVCHLEIEKEWQKRVGSNIDSVLPQTGVPIRFTLIRYMTSLGLKKDSANFCQLSDEDIQNVSKGYNNPIQAKGGLKARIYGLLSDFEEWKLMEDPNSKTFMQRLSYWDAGMNIFKEHWVIGVGTGDNPRAFKDYYEEVNSKLHKDNRFRSHNQYLTIALCFGVIGLLFFFIFLFYPLYFHRGRIEFLHLIFIVLACLSFFPEDTLETQSGVSFFALFYAIFFFRKRS